MVPAALLALAACGSGATVDVTATEYAFGGIPDRLSPGETKFVVENVGGEGHDFILTRVLDEDVSVPEASELPQAEREAVLEEVAATAVFDPGDIAEVTADLRPGPFAYLCMTTTEAGRTHAFEGMWGTFEVS